MVTSEKPVSSIRLHTTQLRITGPLVRLTLILVIAQFCLMGYNFLYLFDNINIRDFLNQQLLSSGNIVLEIGYFLMAQFILYSLYIFIIWLISYSLARLFNLRNRAAVALGITIWALATLSLFVANQVYFPHSQFSFLAKMLASAAPQVVTPQNEMLLLMGSGGILACLIILALVGFLLRLFKKPYVLIFIILVAAAAAYGYFIYLPQHKTASVAQSPQDKPNIIIVGIDSLRPDATDFFQKTHTGATPHIDQFLKNSTAFTRAITPLARTFPAWMSILTGDNPKTTGARNNLIDPVFLKPEIPTVAKLLQEAGYETVYATDEVRFSNIDKSFGFDKVIGPEMGFNDFLLGTLNDFPLSNVVINTPLGKYLFPFSFINRAANFAYYPYMFNWTLQREINKPRSKPLFLAVHFTLAHWPFGWAQSPEIAQQNDPTAQIRQLYESSVHAVDAQVGNFLDLLQKNKLLNSAMVIMLSDHGTGFGASTDRITNQAKFSSNLPNDKAPLRFTLDNQSRGHGTDVLSITQYHVLLAFRLYGALQNQISQQETPVSLIDIAPTILQYLKLASPKVDGISLLPAITQNNMALPNRNLFVETDFTVPGLMVATPDMEKILEQGLHYYTIDCKTGRMIINPELEPKIIAGKQRAVLNYPWLLAVYPDNPESATAVLVNVSNYDWTTNMQSSLAQGAPIRELNDALQQFYGNELHPISNP